MKLRLRAIVIVLFLIAGAMAQISKSVVYKHASGKDLKIDSLIPDFPMPKNGYTARVLFSWWGMELWYF